MTIFNVISLLGGVGLFLFGMSLMGDNLKRVAGVGLEKLLEKLTSNRIKGFALGIGVTAIIQSSAATTVMVLGFVNAGIMKLVQAIPVVFGANIGSTVTAQILRFSGGDGDALWLQLCKPSTLAPILVCGAAFVMLISKNKQANNIAGIFMGFGILFIGMNTMETALKPLSTSENFQNLFIQFNNPLILFLVGMVVTMILQSSSASVGILQALAYSTGTLTFAACLPIIVGQNVGKCITVVLGSLGTGKKAQRLAASHVCFNVIGAIVIMAAMYSLNAVFGFGFWDHVMTKGNIADTHLAFNVITSLILLPFVKPIADLTGLIIRGDKESKIDTEISLLDDIFLDQPAIALEQCGKVMNAMADAISENFKIAIDLLTGEWDDKQNEHLLENEAFLDKAETALSDYMVKVTARGLTDNESKRANEILNSISDFERIGDYCVKIVDVVTYKKEQDIHFTETGYTELSYLINAVQLTIEDTVLAFKEDDMRAALKVEPLYQIVGMLKTMLKDHHIMRLTYGNCSTAAGISLTELVTCMDRMAAHCSNIALHMMQKNSTSNFDMHEEARNIRHSEKEDDIAILEYYKSQYLNPVKEIGQLQREKYIAEKKLVEKTEKKLKKAVEQPTDKALNHKDSTESEKKESKKKDEIKSELKKKKEAAKADFKKKVDSKKKHK